MSSMSATVTVRLVRSFEYKTVRVLYFHELDLEGTTLEQLKEAVDERTHHSSPTGMYVSYRCEEHRESKVFASRPV
jgi:hypothetical protein